LFAIGALAPRDAAANRADGEDADAREATSPARVDERVEADHDASPGGEYGPFFEAEPTSEVRSPTPRARSGQPLFAVGGGVFCFVEDTRCKSSLIADFDFGVGVNVVGSDRGIDVPFTQWRARGGFTVRPFYLARDEWHRWGLGASVSYAQGSPQVATGQVDTSDPFADVNETGPLKSLRVDVNNQLWMSQKRNALHVDFTIGAARTTVLDAPGLYWGTHAEVGMGWGGLAGFYGSLDFLDQDLRAVFGFRTHAAFAGPIIGILALGLAAGGAV
jgi:hypothetical protein